MTKSEFRGKQITTGNWLYGDLMHDSENGCYIYPMDAEGLYKENKVIPETVGQFTGQCDMNGKKIYEGDIIRHSPNSDIYYIVEWYGCELVAKQIGASSYAGIAYWLDVTEVIGNIQDNPGLLNKK